MSDHELLSRLLDGDLEPAESARLRGRIDAEPALAEVWARMQALRSALDDEALSPVPRDLVEAVVHGTPRAAAPSRLPWALAAIAGAAALWVAWLPGPPPPRVQLGPGSHTVEGVARLEVAGAAIDLDGRAAIEITSAEGGTVRGAIATGVAGVALTVAVYEGSARVQQPGEPPQVVQAGDRFTSGTPTDAAHRPASGDAQEAGAVCDAELASLGEQVERLRLESSMLRGRLVTHEGEPTPWPDDAPETVREPFLARAFAERFGGPDGDLVALDCDEYPCLVLVAGRVPAGQEVDWKARLDEISALAGDDHVVIHRRYDDADDTWRYAYAAHAILPADEAMASDQRRRFRMGEAMSHHWPDGIPEK